MCQVQSNFYWPYWDVLGNALYYNSLGEIVGFLLEIFKSGKRSIKIFKREREREGREGEGKGGENREQAKDLIVTLGRLEVACSTPAHIVLVRNKSHGHI